MIHSSIFVFNQPSQVLRTELTAQSSDLHEVSVAAEAYVGEGSNLVDVAVFPLLNYQKVLKKENFIQTLEIWIFSQV
jgi:hypothetical protein